jgi:hypothetical protein
LDTFNATNQYILSLLSIRELVIKTFSSGAARPGGTHYNYNMNGAENMDGYGRIKIFGVGGAGRRAVGLMAKASPADCELIAVDTDWVSARTSTAHHRIELQGATIFGLGSGGSRLRAEKCAEACADRLRKAVSGAELIWIVAGMGGGTGTGAATVIARLAAEAGVPVIAAVTLPLAMEGTRRNRTAGEGIDMLGQTAGIMLVLPLDKLRGAIGGRVTLAEFYAAADRVLSGCVSFVMGWRDRAGQAGSHLSAFRVQKGRQNSPNDLPMGVIKRLSGLGAAGNAGALSRA